MTSVHKPNDIRIFIKQCQSLAENNYDTHYIVPNTESKTINGVKIHGINKVSKNRLHRMVSLTRDVYKKALEINAEVYHFHDPELIPIGLKLKRKGKIVIYDVHEDVAKTILSKTYINKMLRSLVAKSFQIYENISLKKFDYIVAATPFITQRLMKVNSKTINVNNYPILTELFSSETNYEKKNQISYIGGISVNRGINEVVEASKKIKGTINLAGPISNENIKKVVNESNNVEYLSILDRSEVKKVLGESLAGIVTFLPEPNHINAQPNKMFEYMSAGIAVIGSDFPLWREIIEGNNCGLCVDPESPDDIAKAIEQIFDNKEEAIAMGRNGRKVVEERYNWGQEKKKLLKVYEEISSNIKLK